MLFEQGWGLLRASNTQPVLVLRFEGRTEAALQNARARFVEVLEDYPSVALDELAEVD